MSPSSTPPRKSKQNGDEELWTVYSARVCLTSLLHDPSVGPRSNADIFTQTWGDDFVPITEVAPSSTLPYIGRYELMKNLKRVARNRASFPSSTHSVKSISPPPDISASPATAPVTKDPNGEEELSVIPSIFFQANFVLEDPQTFHAVIPWNKLVFCHDVGPSAGAGGPAAKSSAASHKGMATGHRVSLVPSHGTAKLLEEQLSQYLDLVEVHLACQVSSRSDDVFEAMQCYSQLHDDAAAVCAQVRHVRKDLHHADAVVSTDHLKLLKLWRERDTYAKMYRKLKLMDAVHQTQPTIQLLLATHDYVGALDLISTTQEVLQQELAGLQCFRHLGSQLSELEKMINRMMEAEFVQLATARLDMSANDEDGSSAADEEDQLSAVIIGLIRQRNLLFLTHYRDLCFSSLKSQIRKAVLQFMGTNLDISDEQISIAEQMRLLEYPRWRAMLDDVFVSVLAVLLAMEENHKIILRMLAACLVGGESVPAPPTPTPTPTQPSLQRETSTASVSFFDPTGTSATDSMSSDLVTESTNDLDDDMLDALDEAKPISSETGRALLQELDAKQPEPPPAAASDGKGERAPEGYISRAEYAQVAGSSYELLVAACDLAHVRCAKLLGVRTRDVSFTKLRIGEIVQLSRQVEEFIAVTEKITGRQSHRNLRASLMTQCKKVVERFHEEHRSQLSMLLDGERWQQAEVPFELQSLISQLETAENLKQAGVRPPSPSQPSRAHGKVSKSHLMVRGEQFAVAGAPLFLLKMVSEYCQCVNDMPVLVSDILNRLLDLLRLFNKRTGSLVLGAEARRSTGLKTITAKHLALASRCLDAVLSYLPLARVHFQTFLPLRQRVLLTEFDPVFQDYRTHRSEILNKLVSMMEDTIARQLLKWEAKAPIPSASFQGISKQTCKLHEALAPILSPDQLELVFNNVQLSFRTHFLDRIKRLAITPGGPQHGLVSAELNFLAEHLNSLEGLPDLGETLMDVWHHS